MPARRFRKRRSFRRRSRFGAKRSRSRRFVKRRVSTRRRRRGSYFGSRTKFGVPVTKISSFQYNVTSAPYLSLVAGSTVQWRIFNTNNAYDVDNALLNTYMPGFTEWGTFYRRYVVIKTRLTCTFSNQADHPMRCGLFSNPENETVYASWTDFVESTTNPGARAFLLGAKDSATSQKTVSHTIYPLSLYRAGNPLLPMSDNWNTFGNGPVHPVYTYLWAGTPSGLPVGPTLVDTVSFKMQIYMTIKFGDRKVIVRSSGPAGNPTDTLDGTAAGGGSTSLT